MMRRTPMGEVERQRERARLREAVRAMVTSPEARERRRLAQRLHAMLWPFILIVAVWAVLQWVELMGTYGVPSEHLPWWTRHVADNRLRPALEAEVLLSRDLSQAEGQPRVEQFISAAETAGAAPVVVAWLRWEESLPSAASGLLGRGTVEQRDALARLHQLQPDEPWWQILAGMIAAGDNNWTEADRLLRSAVNGPEPVGIPTLPAQWPWQLPPMSSGLSPETALISYGCRSLELYGAALGMMGQQPRAADFADLMARLTVKLAEARWVALSIDGTEEPDGSTWQLLASFPMSARLATLRYTTGHRDYTPTQAEQLAVWQRYVAGRHSMDFGMAGGERVSAIGSVALAFIGLLLLQHHVLMPVIGLVSALFRRRVGLAELASAPVRPAMLGGFLGAAAVVGMAGAIQWHRLYGDDRASAQVGIGALLILIVPLALVPMAAVFVDAAPALQLRKSRLERTGAGVWNMKVRPALAVRMFDHHCFTLGVVAAILASLVGYAAVEGALHHDHCLRAMLQPAAAMRLAGEDWSREHYDGAMAELKGALAATTVDQVRAAISPQLTAEIESEASRPRSEKSAQHQAQFEQEVRAVARELRR